MGSVTRKELLPVLIKVQRSLCAYANASDIDKGETTRFCDCKYGGGHVGHRGDGHEDNGCPEVRLAIAVLGGMTDDEYDIILARLLRKALPGSGMSEDELKDFPRRHRVELMCSGELAIRQAIGVVEEMGADVLLTDAINLLGEAQDKVADYYDKTLTPKEKGSMNVKPLADRVVIKVLDADEMTPGGLHIPSTAKEKPQKGEVVAVGPGRNGDDGKVVPMALKAGDKVLYAKYSGAEVCVDGQDYLIVKESDVLAVI